MNIIHARQTVSVTELKRDYANVVRAAETAPVAVLNHNKPEAYLIGAEAYEQLMDLLEDLEDLKVIEERAGEIPVAVNVDDL